MSQDSAPPPTGDRARVLAIFEGLGGQVGGGSRISLSWRGSGPHPLSVDVREQASMIEVSLGPWRERIEAPGGADGETWAEVGDLVAAACFGWTRLTVDRAGSGWRRCVLGYRTDDGWTALRPRTRWVWPPWARSVTRVLQNDAEPPRWLVLTDGQGGFGNRPWVGLVAADVGTHAGELATDGELDLHPFRPKDVGRLVREYVEVCHKKGVLQLRLVHGKGIGNLRRTVHALLDRHPLVDSYRLGGHGEGSWGATIVKLVDAGAPGEP